MNMTVRSCACVLFLALAACSVSGPPLAPPETVLRVDLARYSGRWYEIASFPQRFQKGCTSTNAVYSIRDDGNIDVLNSCYRNNKMDTVKGKAWVVDRTTNAKLKVSFFWPFRGDYWIIELGKDYEYAVVSAPNRKYLWILSREKQMNAALYEEIVANLKERGFDTARLQKTTQGEQP